MLNFSGFQGWTGTELQVWAPSQIASGLYLEADDGAASRVRN